MSALLMVIVSLLTSRARPDPVTIARYFSTRTPGVRTPRGRTPGVLT
jgi:hypothetical protein